MAGNGPPAAGTPLVAVVGRPNVGKSSLVNRILGRREAIVDATPGVTRDRHSFAVEWAGRRFEIVDTGGLEPGGAGLDERVMEQARLAIEAADVVVLVVDAAAGPEQDDLLVADELRRSGKPAVIAANKVDYPRLEVGASAFYRVGLSDPVPVSALHGTGSGDLLDAVVERLPSNPRTEDPAWASVAIVGRPNVGKSSMLNALLGSGRAIVDVEPGTTRDPVESRVLLEDGETLSLIDTAGMRRRMKVDDPVEYFSLLRSLRTLERVDAALLMVDASTGVTAHDKRIAEEIVESGRACVIALNKWDAVSRDEDERARAVRSLSEGLEFISWAPLIRTSALTRRGIDRVLPAVKTAVGSHRRRIPTPVLNRIVQSAQQDRPHPRRRGKPVRIRYAVQPEVAPPLVLLFCSGPLETGYQRYMERRIREAEPFEGTPLKLKVRIAPNR